jgi:hypothetical protein
MPEASVRMFRRFVDMVRTSGPVTFELQNDPIVLRGTRRILGSVRVLDNGLRGHLNLTRRVNDSRLVIAGRNETGMLAQVLWLTANAGDVGDALVAALP